jgi:hypothetical protein
VLFQPGPHLLKSGMQSFFLAMPNAMQTFFRRYIYENARQDDSGSVEFALWLGENQREASD